MSSSDPITYGDEALNAVAIGRKLANLVDVSPFLLWTEAEADGFGEDFEAVAPDLVRNARARRLQVAFAMAVAAGMPERTRLLIVVEWSAQLLRGCSHDPARATLARVVELARAAAELPTETDAADLKQLLWQSECEEPSGHSAASYAAAVVQCAADRYLDARIGEEGHDLVAPAYRAWQVAADVFGALAAGFGERTDDALLECERILSGIYRWQPPRAV